MKEKKTNLLGRLGEDNELVLVVLEALNIGLDGFKGCIAAAVINWHTDGNGFLDGLLGESLLKKKNTYILNEKIEKMKEGNQDENNEKQHLDIQP
jgi:hypothetical protein